jgi:endonuclease YncB( thermonuclease family)
MPSLARRQAISLRLSNSDGMIKVLAAAVMAAESGVVSVADAMRRSDIYVIDGDTIEVQAKRIRLIDFDAPDLGRFAHCGIERMLRARAASPSRSSRSGGILTCIDVR